MSALTLRPRPWLAACALLTLAACGSGGHSPEGTAGGAGATIDMTNPAHRGGFSGATAGGHTGSDLIHDSEDVGPCGPLSTSPLVIADHQASPRYLALDEGFLYWGQSNIESRTTWRAPKDGSDTPTLLASDVWPDGVAVNDTHVFWSESNDGGRIWRAPKAGGPHEAIVTGQARPTEIVADGQDVFWINSGTFNSSDGDILRWSEGMGAPQVLASKRSGARQLTVQGESVYWVSVGLSVVGNTSATTLYRLDRMGTKPQPQVMVVSSASGIAFSLDADWIYWSDKDGIWRMPIAGGVHEHLSTQVLSAREAHASGECVYFLGSEALVRIARQGGKVSTLAPAESLTHFAVDAGAVYASHDVGRTDGRVVRIPLH